ncbi:hypothetical protein HS088_TW15G00173 [Tripterygium wilfordii]|uniref:Exonuclease domain-containing protein n=1 Tax=Tripterygium wilfordii TaxID=458696 RepID=A0A7J7CKY4_TRIWF|nr:protein NEN1-like [Tripterygium wilfordii]KAF5734681.1 hypothetical protein HS088_TW15G00173 [Tripterygium wilfordii]
MGSNDERSEIAFFDVETTMPKANQGCAILEFGAILVCPMKLEELYKYSSLVRPADPSLIYSLSPRSNGITPDAIASAPYFAEISNAVYDLLHGRIWAGHNIISFDHRMIREAFEEINRPPPEPKWIIDSLVLLRQRFGKRAGDMKMDTLATYFGLRRQIHRSLDDVRMNLEVIKYCATVLFLESSLPDIFTESWVSPDEVWLPDISASLVPFYHGRKRTKLLHKDIPLQLCCSRLIVRFGISTKFVDHAGRPRLSFVVDVDPTLCRVLDACDGVVQKMSLDSDSGSEWNPVIIRKNGFSNYPTARLRISTVVNEDVAQYATEMYQKKPSGAAQKLVFSKFDAAELGRFFEPGTFVDAYFSLDPYDYQQKAGIRLVAKGLIIHSE